MSDTATAEAAEAAPNAPLLRKTVEWVEAQDRLPDDECLWHQHMYVGHLWAHHRGPFVFSPEVEISKAVKQEGTFCGTTYCVAGYIGALVAPERFAETSYDASSGFAMHVSDFARDALRISEDDADRLFDGGNDAADVRRIAEEIAGGPL